MVEKKPDTSGEVPEWVVTYGDLMSLLLCFFILLAAFSELKQERDYREVLESIQEALGFKGGMGLSNIDFNSQDSMTSRHNNKASFSDQSLSSDDSYEDSVAGRAPKSTVIHEGSMLSIGGSIMFEEAEYVLSPSGQDLIKNGIAPQIKGQNYVVYVVGHAWGEREEQSGFDFYELGFRRAKAVIDFMVRECGVDRLILRPMSAGAQEPVTLSPNPVEINTGNRRVQVWQTGRTVDQTHPDPNFTSAGVPE